VASPVYGFRSAGPRGQVRENGFREAPRGYPQRRVRCGVFGIPPEEPVTDPVQKALWYVESHAREPVTLDSIARSCKVSAFHFTRAFGATTGLSLFHRGHVARIRGTMAAISSQWLPRSGHNAFEGPTLERYRPEFNPTTGMGELEIWVPIQE
jgi:methylphosphotriester-DNA--protein-cysteine methyltransferase